ncbi:MAG: hypothetical protein HYZ58_16765 [Acidobacteria bacterium]|nr:hypothetical protein [Acidobacteriota bacterium]MBI3264779.1 hypothetical protein [Acidobacteriota bacterium]
MQKLQRQGRRDHAKNARASRTVACSPVEKNSASVRYRITVRCRATIHETWLFESDQPLTQTDLDDQLFAGNMQYIGGEIAGDEEDREIIDVEQDAVPAPRSPE